MLFKCLFLNTDRLKLSAIVILPSVYLGFSWLTAVIFSLLRYRVRNVSRSELVLS